jgi:hypothetical protein
MKPGLGGRFRYRFFALIVSCSFAFGQSQSPQAAPPERSGIEVSPDTNALLPEPEPLPDGKASLIGGTISNLDRVRDQITVQVFGGNRMKVLFDGRTRVYRNGVASSYRDLRQGERVYLDTQLDGTKIFARNIRVVTRTATGESSGQILSYQSDKGELTIRDSISPQGIKLRVTPDTKISNGDRAASPADLRPGTLVAIKLNPDGDGKGVAREISILATPGTTFIFSGRVTYLDLHNGLLVLVDPRDKKRYDVHFDPGVLRPSDQLRQGADVIATADFDGTVYRATAVTVTSPATD